MQIFELSSSFSLSIKLQSYLIKSETKGDRRTDFIAVEYVGVWAAAVANQERDSIEPKPASYI